MAIHYLIKKANEFETICGDNLRELRYTFLTVTSNSMEIGNLYSNHLQIMQQLHQNANLYDCVSIFLEMLQNQ